MSGRGFTVLGVPIDSVGLGRAEAHGTELSPAAVRAAASTASDGPMQATSTSDSRPPARRGYRSHRHRRRAVDHALGPCGTADLVRRDKWPFLLGGCCTLLVGALAGARDWDELVDLVAPVAVADELVGWSIACYDPEKDPAGADGRAIVAAIERLYPA